MYHYIVRLVHGDNRAVGENEGAVIFVYPAQVSGEGLVAPAGLFLIGDKIFHCHRGSLRGKVGEPGDSIVKVTAFVLGQLTPLPGKPGGLVYAVPMPCEGGKGGELGCPVVHGHGRVNGAHMVRQVDYIIVASGMVIHMTAPFICRYCCGVRREQAPG